ncbi:WG repeat-containing protein [Muricauda sp. 334s03]|uniref:WG repeat-containing protein n=1 Tax=Flagellimonas yonaguniensis TaxID=3031325 RepID=A0ABT5XW81_9FLAO|nr:WG repeat-containing protein [[Muricauda] yonaguniensis]MDF0715394.1 WG repeat-containing protein [[Muricauda] yonaguniensis]
MKKITTLIAAFIYMGLSAQLPDNLDYVSPFHEGFAAIQKENKWAFVDESGNIAIDFRDDLYWRTDAKTSHNDIRALTYPQFSDGRCVVQKMMDEIPVFGFIDTSGKLVIEHKFLNVAPFKNGLTTGIMYEKVHRGKNEFNLDIYEFKFHEVLMDTDGNIIEFLNRRYNIQMTKRRYEMPDIKSKILNHQLIAIEKDNRWEIKKLDL